MPGNEVGDRVHNFFAQDNSLQGQHHSQVVEENWPVLNNNFWVGGQRQINLLNSNNKTYNSQNSDLDGGDGNYPLQNFSQSNARPDFAKGQSLNEQPNSNGFMYGNQFQHTRQNEANFLAMDTDSYQHNLVTSRAPVHDLQQGSGPDHQTKASVRSVTSVSPVSFDLFGGQQQMNHQQSSIPQSLQHQQSGINDMQQLQQQLMIRKMQEHQRQEQLRQLEIRQHHLVNQAPPFAKQSSGSQSPLVNGTPNSDALQYSWTAEPGANWMNRGSPTMQMSSNGLAFPQNLGHPQRLGDSVPQQVDQSLYGVPVSSSRGLTVNKYSQMMTDRSSMPHMSISSNSLQGNQHSLFPDHIGVRDESSISSQKFENENMFGLASRQSLDTELRNSRSRNVPHQEFLGRQEISVPPQTSHEKPSKQAASPQNEVALDPTEEKILFGSDDNIWAAFGKEPHMSGDADSSFDNDGLLNGLPSIQSGSWSALMQSAVAETSGSDIVPQEEWSGLAFHNNDKPSVNQPLSMNNDTGKQASGLANNSMRMPSAPSSGSFPPPGGINTNNLMGLNQLRHNFQDEPGQRVPTEMSQRFFHSLGEANKWSNSHPPDQSVAEGSQPYRNASQHPLEADRKAKSIYPTLMPGQSGNRLQPNGWNSLAAIPPGGDGVQINHEAKKFPQNPQNSQVRVMPGEPVHGSSLLESNSIPGSAAELRDMKYTGGYPQTNKGISSLNAAASVANSFNAGVSDETSSFVQNNYLLNQWKNAHPPVQSQGGESMGKRLHQVNEHNQVLDSMNSRSEDEVRRRETDSYDIKENSNDSHPSNLSQHTSGGSREVGWSDANDPRSLPSGKQKSNNQLPKKVSAPRKFQYHPMGNVYEEEPTNGLKQSMHLQAMSEQNAHFGHSKLFGQFPRNSTAMEKGQSFELQRDTKGPDEGSSGGNLSDHAPNTSVPLSRAIDTYTLDKASSSSQNMLELLHKVDQSKDHDAMMHLSSSECNTSPQLPEAEKKDGIGRLQRSQSSVSHGFGLQLGPPSQRLQIPDHPLSSQNGQSAVNSLYSGHAAAEMGDKGQQMTPAPSVQPVPFVDENQVNSRINRSVIPGHSANENTLYTMSRNYTASSSSGTPYSRTHLQNQQIRRLSGQMPMNQNIDPFNRNASQSTQRGSVETHMPDTSGSVQPDNLGSSGGKSQQSGLNDAKERVPSTTLLTGAHERTSQHSSMPGISQQGDSAQVSNYIWTNVPTNQHNIGNKFQQNASHIPESTLNIIESSSTLASPDFVNSQGFVDGEEPKFKASSSRTIASVNMDTVPKMNESLGKASSMKNRSDDSPANSASTQKDIEAFGRSLKPNSNSHQNYSLLNQMQASKDTEIDSSNRVSKRMKGSDDVLDAHEAALKAGQQNERNAVLGDSLVSSTAVPSKDSRTFSFSRPPGILQRNISEHGNMSSKDALGLAQDVPGSSSLSDYMTSVRVDHPQVSPQMAPSWFNQYGTFKNGQILQTYDTRSVTPVRPGEPPFPLGKSPMGLTMRNSEERETSSPVDASQSGNLNQNSTSLLVPNGHFSSPQSSHVTGQHLVNLRPKKRKSATSELHPWHKEISAGAHNLWTISMADSDWNKAVNRLPEKVEDSAELIEDGPPVLRSKRRLILTTQLMQQLLRPAPAAVLSADAISDYEVVAYAVSRIALGDACGIVSRSSDLDVPHDSLDLLSVKGKSSERSGGQCYVKAVGELIGKAEKLENDFLRLEKSATVSDVRAECLDMEKFSVINRFARFHGRGQTENAETASTDVTSTSQKPLTQRYVTAVPVPRSFPDRVQCLSL